MVKSLCYARRSESSKSTRWVSPAVAPWQKRPQLDLGGVVGGVEAERTPVTLGPFKPQLALCDTMVCQRRDKGGLAWLGRLGGYQGRARPSRGKARSRQGSQRARSPWSPELLREVGQRGTGWHLWTSLLWNFPPTSGEGESPGSELADTWSCLRFLVLPPGKMRVKDRNYICSWEVVYTSAPNELVLLL